MKLTDEELVSIIEGHRADSLGVEDGELSNERALAMDRYHGRPYGNEMEGRSAIVSRDLSEAIDWAMPAIMRIFTQTGTIAEFDPVSQEDEQQAEIETDYTNQVIMKDNNGWMVLHDAIKDTLLLKNGYVKHWWEETEKIEEPKYQGLAIEQVQQLMEQLQEDGCEVKVTGQEDRQIMTPQGPVPVYDLSLRIVRKLGKVRIEAVPCEEIRVSRKCRGSLQDSPFVEHVTFKTRSDLIEMGMPRDFVDMIPAYEESSTSQGFHRDSVADESRRIGTSYNDRAMDEVEYCEAYIRVDCDDDGVAELRRVVTVGNKIPPGDEWNEPIPEVAITSFTAKRVPHRHVGESLYDDLGDLQEIKTTLLRQLFDNIYSTNNSQWLVNERVNLADFLTSLPGGIKRVEGLEPIAGAVEALNSVPIAQNILPIIDYIDGIKEGRTGITKASAGLDPDTLHDVTKGAYMENMQRASQKIEMMTRLIAESVKEMVLRVHSLLIRYQDKQRIVRMKGQYIPINPQEWRERTDLTVKVGLGTGTEEVRQQKLMLVAQLQRDMLGPVGLVEAKQAHNLFVDISKTLGFDQPDKFAMSPDSPEFQQKMQNPPPDQAVMLEQAKQAGEAQKVQFLATQEQQKAQFEAQQKQQEIALQDQQHQREMERDMQIERNKQEMQARENQLTAQIEAERDMQKAQIQAQENAQQLEFERWKTEMDNATRIVIENMKQGAELQPGVMEQQVQANSQLIQAIGEMLNNAVQQNRAPRRIIRDATGRAQGIE